MRHTGKQEFKDIEVTNNSEIYKTSIIDKLNVPIRRSLPNYEYADLFMEANALSIIDSNNYIRQLLDIHNSDIIKSLLTSELFYDEFMNFDKTDTGSFNEKIDINDAGFDQYKLNNTYDITTVQDSTSIPAIVIKLDTVEEGDNIYSNLIEYSSYDIPIRTELVDSLNNNYVYMIYYDSLLQDTEDKELTIYLNSNNNQSTMTDLTNINLIEITLNNFIFKDISSIKNYIKLPYHYHKLNEIEDIDNNTNNENGYIKLNNSTLELNFPQKLNPDQFILKDSFFTKDQKNDLLNNKLFNINCNEDSFSAEVNYTDTTIDLGGGSFIIEYSYTDTNIDIGNTIKLETKNSQEINLSSNQSIYMTDQYNNYYLAEVLKFSYNNIINSDNTGVTDTIDTYYQWIDKTSIDENIIQIYDITDNTVTVINNYYDIEIVQPNINTIPFILINNNKLYKDDDGNVQISIPIEYNNITDNKHLTLRNDYDVYLLSDSTTLTFTIKYMDILNGNQSEEYIYLNESLNTKLKQDRGRVNIVPSNSIDSYSIKLFSRQY